MPKRVWASFIPSGSVPSPSNWIRKAFQGRFRCCQALITLGLSILRATNIFPWTNFCVVWFTYTRCTCLPNGVYSLYPILPWERSSPWNRYRAANTWLLCIIIRINSKHMFWILNNLLSSTARCRFLTNCVVAMSMIHTNMVYFCILGLFCHAKWIMQFHTQTKDSNTSKNVMETVNIMYWKQWQLSQFATLAWDV